jgi:hypothetical protein
MSDEGNFSVLAEVLLYSISLRLVLCLLIKHHHHAIKACGGADEQLHILDLGTRGQLSVLCHDCFAAGRKAPCILWIEGSLGLRASLDALVKSKNSASSEIGPSLTLLPSHSID